MDRSIKRSKRLSRSRDRNMERDRREKDKVKHKDRETIRASSEKKDGKEKKTQNKIEVVDNKNLEEDQLLELMMGFKEFDTTKNKSHVDSDLSGVFKGSQVKRNYRQYMNRKGGFNRSLDIV